MATAPDGSPGGAEGSPVSGGKDGAALAMRMVQAAEADLLAGLPQRHEGEIFSGPFTARGQWVQCFFSQKKDH